MFIYSQPANEFYSHAKAMPEHPFGRVRSRSLYFSIIFEMKVYKSFNLIILFLKIILIDAILYIDSFK